MKLADHYSHMNGLEYLLVHHKEEYDEILDVIKRIDASKHLTKESGEKTKKGKFVYNPTTLNKEFKILLDGYKWESVTRRFYVTTDPRVLRKIEPLPFEEQKKVLEEIGAPLYTSYNQTDFVKKKIAIEVQMGKYFAVTYDLFVKHLSFYTGHLINIGVEIVPTKKMQREMSSGPPFFEKEVHNVLRHGRTNPPVPLLILGVEPD